MKALNQGRQFTTDPPQAMRTAFLVEEEDVGEVYGMYLGQHEYTFEPKDVGRVVEFVQEMSPGFVSWWFGSIFNDIREKYPDPFPYLGAPSASE